MAATGAAFFCFHQKDAAFLISQPSAPRPLPGVSDHTQRQVPYVRRSFWKARDYETLDAANAGLSRWLVEIAGRRIHGTTRLRPLEVFDELEKAALRALPGRPWEPVQYKLAKLHPDSHVSFDRAYYSAPCRLIRKELLVQATPRQVVLWFDHQPIASHVRVGPGRRQTNPDHVPPHKLKFYTQSPAWCRERAAHIGPATSTVIDELLAQRPSDRLRTAQGILSFAERFTAARLEAACRRGLHYGDVRRKTLKNILDNGLDFAPIEGARDGVLPFPRFARTSAEIFGEGDNQ